MEFISDWSRSMSMSTSDSKQRKEFVQIERPEVPWYNQEKSPKWFNKSGDNHEIYDQVEIDKHLECTNKLYRVFFFTGTMLKS